jgi:hypothetical protein
LEAAETSAQKDAANRLDAVKMVGAAKQVEKVDAAATTKTGKTLDDRKAYAKASQENLASVPSDLALGGALGLGQAEPAMPGAEPAVGLLQAMPGIIPEVKMRTANVTSLSAGTPPPQVSFAGCDHWAGCSAVRVNEDRPWIRFNGTNLVKNIHAATPGPILMRCGDVERNPGLRHPNHMGLSDFSHGVKEYTHEDLEEMKRWQIDKINERLQDVINIRKDLNHRHPLVLHRGDHESEKFQSIFTHEEPAYIRQAMTNLAVLSEVAEPSFLFMINWVETSFDNE